MDRGYLAGPFFTNAQLEFIKEIESIFRHKGRRIKLFSPRSMGIKFSDIPQEEHAAKAYEVLYRNVGAISTSDFLLAVLDDSDPGTMFEIGYAFKSGIPIITCSREKVKVNAMIAEVSFLNLKEGIHPVERLAEELQAPKVPSRASSLEWELACHTTKRFIGE